MHPPEFLSGGDFTILITKNKSIEAMLWGREKFCFSDVPVPLLHPYLDISGVKSKLSDSYLFVEIQKL